MDEDELRYRQEVPVIAASKAALKPSFPGPVLPPTTSA
jgi:hypothetical protein